ncbi:class I SAM-dependent methyltransferase [Streptodolium elevatio]|uniref:Class I SAM-dependent methyltransferase n=1 Tax=Streptodolium elevatio TaxID=3157996 RepID=A0ABV3DBH0_9ACTN
MTDQWTGSAYDLHSDAQHTWGTEVLARLELPPNATVLDAGCGSGRVTGELLRTFPSASVVAADVSRSMLDQARDRLAPHADRLVLRQVDLEDQLPFEDNTFDAVFSTGALHWVRDHGSLFADFARVLRPGGHLVVQCGGHGSLARVRAVLAELGVDTAGRNHYATAEQTTARLAGAGFAGGRAWLANAPVSFTATADLEDFLAHAALQPYLTDLPEPERRAVVRAVAARLEPPVLDFVRLNMTATIPASAPTG